MKIKYLVLLLLAGCSSSYNYASIGFGHLEAHHWLCSQSATGWTQLGRVYVLKENHHLDLNLTHTSQPNCGEPFNTQKKETSTEFIGAHYRYIFGRNK